MSQPSIVNAVAKVPDVIDLSFDDDDVEVTQDDEVIQDMTTTAAASILSWTCPACTFFNQGHGQACAMCEQTLPRPNNKWTCRLCTFCNPQHVTTCTVCEQGHPVTRRAALPIENGDTKRRGPTLKRKSSATACEDHVAIVTPSKRTCVVSRSHDGAHKESDTREDPASAETVPSAAFFKKEELATDTKMESTTVQITDDTKEEEADDLDLYDEVWTGNEHATIATKKEELDEADMIKEETYEDVDFMDEYEQNTEDDGSRSGKSDVPLQVSLNPKTAVSSNVKEEIRESDRAPPVESAADVKREADNDAGSAVAVRVKTERDMQNHVAATHRKYGDRVLLARQAKNGIMKLGGGNCGMRLYPGETKAAERDHPRFDVIGDKIAIWYNDNWQPLGPKYAGDPSAAVDEVFQVYDRPFSVFMKRGNLGTEYCGDYQYAQDPEVATHKRACDVKEEDKKKVRSDLLSYLKSANSVWRTRLCSWKRTLDKALAEDQSPADLHSSSLAARARALGYHEGMTLEKMARSVVLELNEFYRDMVIRFVEYDEVLFNYVKEGETTRTAKGKKRRRGEACAKASDWYTLMDQREN